jgi:hypothetical protein
MVGKKSTGVSCISEHLLVHVFCQPINQDETASSLLFGSLQALERITNITTVKNQLSEKSLIETSRFDENPFMAHLARNIQIMGQSSLELVRKALDEGSEESDTILEKAGLILGSPRGSVMSINLFRQ